MTAVDVSRSAPVIKQIVSIPELAETFGEAGGRISYDRPGKRREAAQTLLKALGVGNVVDPSTKDENLLEVIHWTICEFFNHMRNRADTKSRRSETHTRDRVDTKPRKVGTQSFDEVRDIIRPQLAGFFQNGFKVNFSTPKFVQFEIDNDVSGMIYYTDDKASVLKLYVTDTEKWGISEEMKGKEIIFKLDHASNTELLSLLNKKPWETQS